MSSTTHDRSVLRKLEALLAKEASLRGSPEPHSQHEAEATAKAIARLLLRYHLSLSDVESAAVSQDAGVGAALWEPEAHGLAARNRTVFWQEELASIVAEAHLCALLVVTGSNRLYFVGAPQDREVAVVAYGLLARFADQSSREAAGSGPHSKGYRAAWLRGFNLRIAERYRDLEHSMVQQAIEQNEALARLPGGTGITVGSLVGRLASIREAARAWVAQHATEAQAPAGRPPSPRDLGALRDGYAAGSRPPLRQRRAVPA